MPIGYTRLMPRQRAQAAGICWQRAVQAFRHFADARFGSPKARPPSAGASRHAIKRYFGLMALP